jgi:hypothetical protein
MKIRKLCFLVNTKKYETPELLKFKPIEFYDKSEANQLMTSIQFALSIENFYKEKFRYRFFYM